MLSVTEARIRADDLVCAASIPYGAEQVAYQSATGLFQLAWKLAVGVHNSIDVAPKGIPEWDNTIYIFRHRNI